MAIELKQKMANFETGYRCPTSHWVMITQTPALTMSGFAVQTAQMPSIYLEEMIEFDVTELFLWI